MLTKSLCTAVLLAVCAATPLAGSAMASPKPAGAMKSAPHQCRDAKGHFVKGKYAKCPAGTHKAM